MISLASTGWADRLKRHVALPQWLRLRRHPYPEQFSPDLDLAPFEGRPTIYMMATTPRSGSHFVGHALSTGGRLGFPLEYLNRGNLDLWRHRFQVGSDEAALLKIMRHRTGTTGLFGLKAHWTQFHPFSTHPLLTGPQGIRRIVWLTRRNVLAQAISFVIATQTGQFISGATRRGRSRFDYDAIVRCARSIQNQNEHWQRHFAETPGIPVLHAEFEAIMADQAAGLAAIAAFLDPGTPPEIVPSEKTQRQSDDTARIWADRFRREVRDEDRWVLDLYRPTVSLP